MSVHFYTSIGITVYMRTSASVVHQAARRTTVERLDVRNKPGTTNSIRQNWFAAHARMCHVHRCVRSMARTSLSTSVAIVVRWPSSSASEPLTSATLVTTTSNASLTFQNKSCHAALQVRKLPLSPQTFLDFRRIFFSQIFSFQVQELVSSKATNVRCT